MNTKPRGRVYIWTPDTTKTLGGSISLNVVGLQRLDSENPKKNRLCGRHVCVRNAGAVNEPVSATGGVEIAPLGDARPDVDGDFFFAPGRGGGRIDKVEWLGATASQAKYLESGVPFSEDEFRWRYIQASHFGEVNTYYHLDLVAAYIDDLLRELRAPPLPHVTAIVNAHAAVTERDGLRDGLQRGDRWLPFQGGHYRLPGTPRDLPEYGPIATDGEIHLGPGRNLLQYGALVEAAGGPYRANASHNAGIIYHEYGHHLTRHTADFRANSLCSSDKQDNRKAAIDEGTCDYWAATMLGTPHIWAWHLRHDSEVIHPRSLSSDKTMAQYDSRPSADPHANGTIWGAALWEVRTRLRHSEADGVRRADLILLQALLLLGRLVDRSSSPTTKGTRRRRQSYAAGLVALLQADGLLNSGRYGDIILSSFQKRGIQLMDGC